jgi:hypothetical protein
VQRVSLGEAAKRAHENGNQTTLGGLPYRQGWRMRVNRTKFEAACWRILELLVSTTASTPSSFVFKAMSSEMVTKYLHNPSYLQSFQISWKFSLLSKPYSIKASLKSRGS